MSTETMIGGSGLGCDGWDTVIGWPPFGGDWDITKERQI